MNNNNRSESIYTALFRVGDYVGVDDGRIKGYIVEKRGHDAETMVVDVRDSFTNDTITDISTRRIKTLSIIPQNRNCSRVVRVVTVGPPPRAVSKGDGRRPGCGSGVCADFPRKSKRTPRAPLL